MINKMGNGCMISSWEPSGASTLLIKLILYSLLLTLIIHYPLGESRRGLKHGGVRWSEQKNVAIDNLCGVYKLSKKLAEDAIRSIQVILQLISERLYRGKIMFYKALGQLDSDLCRYACSDTRTSKKLEKKVGTKRRR